MKTMALLKMLQRYPVFSFNEFVRITGFSPNYARLHLFRLKKEGIVFKIEKGKYTVFNDPMVIASFITTPSYLSFWTALRYYNMTEQLPLPLMIAVPRPKKRIMFNNTKILFFKTKNIWGYKKERYTDFDIFIAEKEKAVIDSLTSHEVPFDEVIKAIKSGELDIEKLVDYAIKAGNVAVMKRIGYILEFFRFDVNRLLARIDKNYILLDNAAGKKGKRIKRWKVIANRRIDDIS